MDFQLRKKGFDLDHGKKNVGLILELQYCYKYCCVSPPCECDELPAEGAIVPACVLEPAIIQDVIGLSPLHSQQVSKDLTDYE